MTRSWHQPPDLLAAAYERFLAKIEFEPNSGCWLWAARVNRGGYGEFGFDRKVLKAHTFSYMYHIGRMPEGLVIDHRCRVRCCVNPHHLEPVTQLENVRRSPIHCGKKTHCPHGHPYSGDNLVIRKNGRRRCRICIKNEYIPRGQS